MYANPFTGCRVSSCISSIEALQTLMVLSDLYPEAKLSKEFIAPIFGQVVQVHLWYTFKKAILLDNDFLTMTRNFCLSGTADNLVENVQGMMLFPATLGRIG
jgi:hypothetical protein